ncbi:unnamed protein product [Linum tenue]|nr:unnamed protein product [Linum tenue]
MVGDNYLTVHPWTSDFNPYEHEISSTLVWARLLEIPIHYFHPVAVMRIGQRIGKPIRVDQATSTGARSDYARVCVQVDLTKPLLSKFSLHGKKYFIQYEGLDNICLKCGTYVTRGSCSCMAQSMEEEAPPNASNVEIPPEKPDALYGDWMIAQRRPRPKKESGNRDIATGKSKVNNDKTRKEGPGGSRYNVLVVDEMKDDTGTGNAQGEGSVERNSASVEKVKEPKSKQVDNKRKETKSAGSNSEKTRKGDGTKTSISSAKKPLQVKGTVILTQQAGEKPKDPVTALPGETPQSMPRSTQPRIIVNGVHPMEPEASQGHKVRPPDERDKLMEKSGTPPLEKTNEIIMEGLVNEASTT